MHHQNQDMASAAHALAMLSTKTIQPFIRLLLLSFGHPPHLHGAPNSEGSEFKAHADPRESLGPTEAVPQRRHAQVGGSARIIAEEGT